MSTSDNASQQRRSLAHHSATIPNFIVVPQPLLVPFELLPGDVPGVNVLDEYFPLVRRKVLSPGFFPDFVPVSVPSPVPIGTGVKGIVEHVIHC
jgi:hypothetical protein